MAPFVRSLSFRWARDEYYHTYLSRTSEKDLKLLITASSNVNDTFRSGLEKLLEQDPLHGCIAVLVSSCAQLKALDLSTAALTDQEGPPEYALRTNGELEALLSKAIPLLKNLRELSCMADTYCPTSLSWETDLVRECFPLPSLRRLNISIGQRQAKASWLPKSITLPSLHTLELHTCTLNEYAIGQILSRMPALKTLHMSLVREWPAEDSIVDEWFDLPKLKQVITEYLSLLEE